MTSGVKRLTDGRENSLLEEQLKACNCEWKVVVVEEKVGRSGWAREFI